MKDLFSIKDKVALVTGGSRGIGEMIAAGFLASGAKVYISSRKAEICNATADRLSNEYGGECISLPSDLSHLEGIESLVTELSKKESHLDILINNAATISTSLFQMTKIDDAKKLYNINFFSQFLFTQFILKAMTKNKNGSIVFVSSTSSQDGNVGRSVYSSSKSAINALALTLSKELGSKNIRVNIVAPGLTNTDMMKKNTPTEKINEVISLCSLRRFAEPREIANAVLFLSSNLSSYITGQTLRVDGGMKWVVQSKFRKKLEKSF